MTRVLRVSALLPAWLLLFCLSASAQVSSSGSIAGVARDTTGGVLPGVTVEAASPALIEKVRSVTTDGEGVYRIVDLRPGVYSVTFTLPGFATFKRDGLELAANVTTTVNVELRAGDISETITVTGASPLVDLQNASQVRTVTTAMLEDLPAGRTFVSMAALVPGAYIDGGGSARSTTDVGTNSGDRPLSIGIHGSKATEMPLLYDGMRFSSVGGSGGGRGALGYTYDNGTVQEMAIDTSSASAEYEVSGFRANAIPKQGGNRFETYFLGSFANDKLNSTNLDADQQARGVPEPAKMLKTFDVNPGIGGPIRPDRVWFYFSYRRLGIYEEPPGVYRDKDPTDWVFTPDTTKKDHSDYWRQNTSIRLTMQTTRKSKLALYWDDVRRLNSPSTMSLIKPREGSLHVLSKNQHLYMGTWNWTATNKLLFEAGLAGRPDRGNTAYQPGTEPYASALESTTGVRFRAVEIGGRSISNQYNAKVSMTYVTGSHTLKVGMQDMWGTTGGQDYSNTDYTVTLTNGEPISATFSATPNTAMTALKANLGLFAQEQWTRKRLTAMVGVRFDYVNAYVPEQSQPAGRYVAARSFAPIYNVPNWKDISPRFGLTYDLFGTGRTAVKWNMGRYLTGTGTGIASPVNPATTSATSTRAWNDANKDFIPQENELGPHSNANFGTTVITTGYAPDTVVGWGLRGMNWETMVGVQHELRRGVAVEASYFHHTFGNFRVSDNTLVSPTDFDPYFVMAPVDPRLPNGGGYRIDGLYNVSAARFGQSRTSITPAERFGKQTEVWDGIDLTTNTRIRGGLFLQGGLSTGRTKTNNCFVVDSPQALRFCDSTTPMLNNFKIIGIYPLPLWGIQSSATFTSLPGPEITATWAAPASAVQGLGRALSGGARTVSVALIQPGTVYGDRQNLWNARFTKRFKMGSGGSIEPQLDIYNVFNANPVLEINNTYGPAWQNVNFVLQARLIKFGVQMKF